MLLNIVFMVLGAGLFVAGFVWMQREKDDRESLQIYGWAAYLGAALLALGIGWSLAEYADISFTFWHGLILAAVFVSLAYFLIRPGYKK